MLNGIGFDKIIKDKMMHAPARLKLILSLIMLPEFQSYWGNGLKSLWRMGIFRSFPLSCRDGAYAPADY